MTPVNITVFGCWGHRANLTCRHVRGAATFGRHTTRCLAAGLHTWPATRPAC